MVQLKKIKKQIFVTSSFSAIHNWPECDLEGVYFLKYPHRHVFHIKVYFETEGNREKEFILEKNSLDSYISKAFANKNIGSMSCEQIAEKILRHTGAIRVEVSEDNENGAIIEVNNA